MRHKVYGLVFSYFVKEVTFIFNGYWEAKWEKYGQVNDLRDPINPFLMASGTILICHLEQVKDRIYRKYIAHFAKVAIPIFILFYPALAGISFLDAHHVVYLSFWSHFIELFK